MKKLLKFLFITVGLISVLAVVAVVAATILINPNDYKDDIVKAVKDQTGRRLDLQGDISLSFFPWLGLELGETRFSNASGFGNKPMASIKNVEVKLKLLPLLRKQVQVKTIVLDSLELDLACNRLGRCNWDDLAATSPTPEAREKVKPAGKKPSAGKKAIAALTIGGVDIRHGQVRWTDGSGNKTHVRNISLKTGQLAAATPMEIRLGFDLETGKPVIRTPVVLQGQVTVDPSKETLDVRQLRLSLLDLELIASLSGKNILQSPQLNGQLQLKPANLRGLLKQLGITMDMQADALQTVALNTNFSFSQKANTISIDQLKLNLDDSKLAGDAAIGLGTTPVIRTTISVDKIDIDRYLPTGPKAVKPGKSKAKTKPVPLMIPVEPLRKLNLKGKFSLDSLKAMGIRSTSIVIPVSAEGGLISVGPSRARLYGGNYVGKQVLDVRKGAPRIQSDEKLTNVEIGGLLKDAGIFDKFSGVGNVSGNITARGIDVDDILNTLNGSARASLKNGRIKGLNLHKLVNDAKDAYEKAKGRPVQTRPKVTDEMEYANLSASAKIKNGVVSNSDLKMDGPFTKVTGAGVINLPKSTMDYRAQVLISENKNDPPVPVRIHGPFSKLGFSVEWDKILKERAQKEVQKRVDEERKKVEENIKKQLNQELQKLFKR